IFIHHALVEGDVREPPPFLRHNLGLVDEVRRLEAKARRQDILADARTLFEFYDTRLGRDVYSTSTLQKGRAAAERENPRALFMRREDLLTRDAAEVTAERFPDQLPVAG